MSTESMTQFLEDLHSSRLLENERVEELLRRPESPEGDVDGIARFLEGQGWLTKYQIEEIRQGRGAGLMFSGYRLLERLPDTSTGKNFKAFHPALQQAVVVCWVNAEALPPNDNIHAYIERARSASAVTHPNLVNILDAGFSGDTAFVVHEYVDGANLGSLVADMGALPVALACQYSREAAAALQAAHERGIFHGEISPSRLLLAPVVRKAASNGIGQPSIRPAAGAIVRLEGLGLPPLRPHTVETSSVAGYRPVDARFSPPERSDAAAPDARSDLYSLGATLYFLLAARPPASAPVAADFSRALPVPTRLDTLRKDVSPALADLVNRMLSGDPSGRPSGSASVVQYLLPFSSKQAASQSKPPQAAYAIPVASETDTRPNSLPAVMAAAVPPDAIEVHEPLVEALPAGTRDSQVYRPVAVNSYALDDGQDDFQEPADTQPRPLKPRPKVKGGWTWLILGACLHITAITVVILYVLQAGPFAPSTPTEPAKAEKTTPKRVNK